MLSRLRHLSATSLVRTLSHLRADTNFQQNMHSHLAHLRKQQHQVWKLNYDVQMANSNAAAAAPPGSTAAKDGADSSSLDSEHDNVLSSATTPLPASCVLSATLLVPPLPAVSFLPITPIIATSHSPNSSSSASGPSSNGMPIITTSTNTDADASAPATTAVASHATAALSSAAAPVSSFLNATAPPTPSSVPAHKMHILFCLRFLRLRTLKDRVFSVLNFFRSIERKLVLDDASFAFEDRFQFAAEHIVRTVPHTAPAPFRNMEKLTNANSAASTLMGGGAAGGGVAATGSGGSGGSKGSSDPSLPSIACSGADGCAPHIHMPRLHTHLATYLPTDYERSEEAFMAFQGIERRDDTYKWRPAARGRSAAAAAQKNDGSAGAPASVDEWEGEVQVDDCCGMPVVYDVVDSDFAKLEEQLMCIGTYFINEHRSRGSGAEAGASSASGSPVAAVHDVVDRWSLLLDLWECEAEFQVLKGRLVDIYLEVLEHVLVRDRQHEVVVRILELVQLRPYIDLAQGDAKAPGQSRYFTQFYALHSKLILQRILFLRALLDWQMSHEKQQSKRWEAGDWRVFLQTKKQIREQEERSGKSASQPTAQPPTSSASSESKRIHAAPSRRDVSRRAQRALKLSQRLQRRTERAQKREASAATRAARIEAGEPVSDTNDEDDSTSSSSSDCRQPA